MTTLISQFLLIFYLTPALTYVFDPTKLAALKTRDEKNVELEPSGVRIDIMDYVHGKTIKHGNISDSELQSILDSLTQMVHPESPRFHKLKVYEYEFGDPKESSEVLVYTDPDENKQWVVDIEDIDMRQNLIIFRIGDLGFGFRKENTFVIIRKSTIRTDPFHYINLVHVPSKKLVTGVNRVEWDNLRPSDFIPVPFKVEESPEDHALHCIPRKCGLLEAIFGTCIIVQLSCDSIKGLPLFGHDKERIDSLIRDKQPFLYEIARSLSISKSYLNHIVEYRRTKRDTNVDEDSVEIPDLHISLPQAPAMDALSQHENTASTEDDSTGVHKRLFPDAAKGAHLEGLDTWLTMPDGTVMSSRVFRSDNGPKDDKPHDAATPEKKTTEANQSNIPSSQHIENAQAAGATQPEGVIIASPENAPEHESDNNLYGSHSPSAFDLLLLQNNNTQPTSQKTPLQKLIDRVASSQTYFDNIIDKIRTGPPAKYTNRPFECVNCEGMGNFFTEYEESIQTATFVVNILADMFMDAKIADIFNPEAQEMLREHWSVSYVGYGKCPYNPFIIGTPPKSTEVDDIIDFYAETLALNCGNDDCEAARPKNKLRELLTSKYHMVEVYFDMTVRFNKTSQLPKHAILSTHEFDQFMISLIFSSYTQEFRRILTGQQEEDVYLPNHNQSYRMRFLTRVILRVLNDIIHNFPQHLIKACRLLLQILQDKFSALLVEHFGILEFDFQSNPKERKIFIELNAHDRIQAMALKDFIIYGLVPIGRSGTPSEQVFATFFIRNRERIKNSVLLYGLDDESFYKEESLDRKEKEFAQEVDLFGQSSIEVRETYEPPISSIEVELEEAADTVQGSGVRDSRSNDKANEPKNKQNYVVME